MKEYNRELVKWKYNKDADIVIGELHEGRIPKILLLLLLLFIFTVAGLGYYFRFELYDMLVKPEIWLTEEEITLEVGEKFIPEDYIYRLPTNKDRYTYTYPKSTDVDTNKIGKYTVKYILTKPNGEENIKEMKVLMVDTQVPTIKLKENNITLTREEYEFDCNLYIEEVNDNYDKDIKAVCNNDISDKEDTYKVSYIAEDSSNNKTIEYLTINWKDAPKFTCWDGSTVKDEKDCPIKPTPTPTPTPVPTPVPTPIPSTPEPQVQQQPTQNTQPSNQTPQNTQPVQQPVQQSTAPYINASNCTVKVGDIGGLQACLSNVQTNVVVSVSYSGVNLTIPGNYTATYSGGGITKNITVTVVE